MLGGGTCPQATGTREVAVSGNTVYCYRAKSVPLIADSFFDDKMLPAELFEQNLKSELQNRRMPTGHPYFPKLKNPEYVWIDLFRKEILIWE